MPQRCARHNTKHLATLFHFIFLKGCNAASHDTDKYLTGSQVRLPLLFESLLTPWSFYETHTLVPVFANQKRFEEDFCFYKKKIDFSIFFFVLVASPFRESYSPSNRRDPAKVFPGDRSQHLSIESPNFELSVSICALSPFILESISNIKEG